jgi:hypothetical protein
MRLWLRSGFNPEAWRLREHLEANIALDVLAWEAREWLLVRQLDNEEKRGIE